MYLQKFLAENRSQLNEMILSETNIHPLIVEVYLLFKVKNIFIIIIIIIMKNFLAITYIINWMST